MKSRYKNEIARAIGISVQTLSEDLHTEPLFGELQKLGYRMNHKRLYGVVLGYVCKHYGIDSADFGK